MIRAVIAENDPMVSDINRRYLEKDGRFDSIEIFKNGLSVQNYLLKNHADLILLDVYMPQIGGFDLLQTIRERQIDCDAILITAANDPESLDKALKLGALDYILKPFEYNRFGQALNKFFMKRDIKARSDSCISQKDADRLFSLSSGEEKREKGIQPQTLGLVKSFLEENRDKKYSGGEIAGYIGLSRVTVYKYLNYMENLNMLKSEIDYETEGRPCLRYFII